MDSINHVFITGNVTRDPDLSATAGGTSVLSFGIAVNESRRVGQQWEEYANYFDVTIFGNRAEALSRIMKRGMHVAISGRLKYRSWEKDGQRRSKVEIIANEVELPPRPKVEQAEVYTRQRLEDPQTWQQPRDVYDDEIPF